MNVTTNKRSARIYRPAIVRGAIALAVASAAPSVRVAMATDTVVPASNTTSFRQPGSAQEGAGDGSVPTISISGSTALKNFLISPGSTYLTSGTSIVLGDGTTAQPEITYTAPSNNSAVFQLGSGNFATPDTTTGNNQTHSALTFQYHEAGSAEGTQELVDSQINSATFTDKTEYNPNTTQAVWINRAKFGGNGPTGPIPTSGTPTVTANGFSLSYQTPGGPRVAGSQNLVQIAVSDSAPLQNFSYAGASNPFLVTPGQAGYGKGNPALSYVGGFETHVAGGNVQLTDQTALNMVAGAINPSYNPNQPRTGSQTYGVGAWNTAGIGNLNSTVVANTATVYAANPGTGLEHLNRTDAQFLLATGHLQNGAAFNVTTRDLGSGTRNVSAVNAGLDPSYAVGVNDRGDGNAADGGTTQISVGSVTVTGPGALPGVTYTLPGITFSNKTSGGAGLRPTVQNSRMAVGTLGMSDFISGNGQGVARPLRAMAYRDDANNINDNSNGNSFKNWSEDGAGNPISTTGDLASNTYVLPTATTITNGSYVLYQNEQFVTVKVPDAAYYNNGNIIKGDNGSTVSVDGSGNDTGKGHDVADFIHNITSAVANQPLPTTTSLANPADALLANGFIVPQLMLVQKSTDGLSVSSVNPNYNSNYRNNVFLADPATATRFNAVDPSTVTSGTSSTYGSVNPAGGQGSIKITDDPTAATSHSGGNWLFGNFNQNGVRDLSAVQAAQDAQAKLFASGHGVDMFAGDANNSTVAGLATPLAGMYGQSQYAAGTIPGGTVAHGAEKGDLIVLGDLNGDGRFNGQDLYLLATGAALSDASGSGYTNGTLGTASGATFADQVRNGVLRKNTALDYMQSHATVQQKVDARAIVFDASGTKVLADNDPTGANAFNKFDINRDGVETRQDAQIVDAMLGKDFSSLTDNLNAVLRTDSNPAGTAFVDGGSHALDPTSPANAAISRKPFNITGAVLLDGKTVVDAADLKLITSDLISQGKLVQGDANFDGKVDFSDFVALATHFGQADPHWSDGNFLGDPTVDFADFVALSTHFGANSLTSVQRAEIAAFAEAHSSAVPEPGSLALAGMGALGLLARRRKIVC
jgi:PEP-CTERM motif